MDSRVIGRRSVEWIPSPIIVYGTGRAKHREAGIGGQDSANVMTAGKLIRIGDPVKGIQ